MMTFISMLHCPNSFYSQHVSGPLPLVLVSRRLGRSFPTANRLPFSSWTRLHLPASQQRKHQIEENQGTHCLPPSRLLLLLHLNSAGLWLCYSLLIVPAPGPGSPASTSQTGHLFSPGFLTPGIYFSCQLCKISSAISATVSLCPQRLLLSQDLQSLVYHHTPKIRPSSFLFNTRTHDTIYFT
jgi:hypothetical protein